MQVIPIVAPPNFDGSEGTIATIVRASTLDEGTKFVSERGDPLQVGVLRHEKGWRSAPHIHSLSPREVRGGGEVLVILLGDVEVCFFDSRGSLVDRRTLTRGDVLIQHAGGHSFRALSDLHMVEVKQGPYRPDEKVYFQGKQPCKDKL